MVFFDFYKWYLRFSLFFLKFSFFYNDLLGVSFYYLIVKGVLY